METDRSLLVAALVAAGYQVVAVNPATAPRPSAPTILATGVSSGASWFPAGSAS
jgi:hypothetical protein